LEFKNFLIQNQQYGFALFAKLGEQQVWIGFKNKGHVGPRCETKWKIGFPKKGCDWVRGYGYAK